MTHQEIFDKVVAHLKQQREVSRDDYGVPAYRGKNGLKCAIGCLIEDEFFDLRHNSDDVGVYPSVHRMLRQSGVPIPEENCKEKESMLCLLKSLQFTHDRPGFFGYRSTRPAIDIWRDDLIKVASSFNLQFNAEEFV